jgi:hypothetical protein
MAENSNSDSGDKSGSSGGSDPKPAPPQGPPVTLVKGGRTPGIDIRTGSIGGGNKK